MANEWKQLVLTGDITQYTDALARAACIAAVISDNDLTHSPDGNSVFDALALKAPIASPTFTGIVTMNSSVIIPDGGTIGQVAGPLLNFDDTLNYLEITGCKVGIGTTTPGQALELVGSLKLEMTTTSTTGVIYKGTSRFIHNFQHPTGDTAIPAGYNTFIGIDAGNFTMGSTATNIIHGSYNIGIGSNVLFANTKGYSNIGAGLGALSSNTIGYYNMALGTNALQYNITGYYNVAIGGNAGRYWGSGTDRNETSNTSLFLGSNTGPLAAGDANEIIIGYAAIGLGSNTIVLGNDSIVKTALKGKVGIGTTTPTAVLHLKAGTIAISTAPLKFTSGPVLTTPEAGTIEFLTDAYYGTITTGPARKTFAFLESPSFTTPTLGAAIATSLDIAGTLKVGALEYFSSEIDNGNSGTADTINWTAGNYQKSTLTGNCTFTFTAPPGPCSLSLKLTQDATGSRLVTWPANVLFPGNVHPTLSTGANKIDVCSFYFDGTNYLSMGWALNYS